MQLDRQKPVEPAGFFMEPVNRPVPSEPPWFEAGGARAFSWLMACGVSLS
jgi:hypothetical protein